MPIVRNCPCGWKMPEDIRASVHITHEDKDLNQDSWILDGLHVNIGIKFTCPECKRLCEKENTTKDALQ